MLQSHTAQLGNISLRYQTNSPPRNNKPVVLFGHSYLWNSDMWREQAEALAEDFRCIFTDLPAHGESGLLEDGNYTIKNLADLHAQLMTMLGVDKYHVVGLSVGGMWGTQLAISHPDKVKSLTVMDSFVGPEPEDTRKIYFGLLDKIEGEGLNQEMLDNLTPYFLTKKTIAKRKDLVERFQSPLSKDYESSERRKHLCDIGREIFTRENLLEKLAQLPMPIQFIVGNEDVPRPPHESELMAKHCKDAKVHVVEHAAHISNVEQPEIVTRLLKNFIK